MHPSEAPLNFRGGVYSSAAPLATFLVGTLILVIRGAPAVEGMIVAAMLGLSFGMLLARNMVEYGERVFTLMANRIATVAIACWLWAGAFSGILAQSGLVEAIVWLGWRLNLTGAAFTVVTFISAALFAISVGTGLGTIVGFTAVMYPAGVVLGANPAALMGAIFSGAALGDNLAPVSDTTIVSAATQETDIGGVVRSRLKYVLITAAIATILFLLFGRGAPAINPEEATRILYETADPTGLPMLIPGVVVFVLAVSGFHFLTAITAGIVTALVVGPLTEAFPITQAFHISPDRTIGGSMVDGLTALLPISILTLLLVTAFEIMATGGFLTHLLEWLRRTLARSVTGAEAAIVILISLANLCVSVNTVAMITVGPLVNELRKPFRIHPYRSANLLDTISCSFPYMLPYGAGMVAAAAIQQRVAERYPFVPILTWSQEAPYVFYAIVLFPLMIVAVLTGFGRRRG